MQTLSSQENFRRSETQSSPYKIENWGRISFEKSWELQKIYLEERIENKRQDTLIFCEHDPVITIGRAAAHCPPPKIYNSEIPVYSIERGGLATYHGPGQMVVYPIFQLGKKDDGTRLGIVDLVRNLEEWVMQSLTSLKISSQAIPKKTGVWVDGQRKIASVGMATRHWVSYHGLSFNFNTGREPWNFLDPCGMSSAVMTDLSMETKNTWTYEEVFSLLNKYPLKN